MNFPLISQIQNGAKKSEFLDVVFKFETWGKLDARKQMRRTVPWFFYAPLGDKQYRVADGLQHHIQRV